jgi:hypothetical protein
VIIALEASGVYRLRWRSKVPLRDPSRRARFWFLIFSQLLRGYIQGIDSIDNRV